MKNILLDIIQTHPFLKEEDKFKLKGSLVKHFEHVDWLEDRERFLTCLESAGVDNWSGGYDYAWEPYNEEQE